MLSSICAFLALGETPTGLGLLGLLAVVAGIALITTQGDLSAFVSWGSATGALIATYTVPDAYGVKVLGIAPVILDWFSNLLRFVLMVPVVARSPARALALMQGKWSLAVWVGLLSPLSYSLVLAALGRL